MGRKPAINKVDAAMIAVRYASAHGIAAAERPEIIEVRHEGIWSVFVPNGSHLEPGGVIVQVDQHTGEANFLPTL